MQGGRTDNLNSAETAESGFQTHPSTTPLNELVQHVTGVPRVQPFANQNKNLPLSEPPTPPLGQEPGTPPWSANARAPTPPWSANARAPTPPWSANARAPTPPWSANARASTTGQGPESQPESQPLLGHDYFRKQTAVSDHTYFQPLPATQPPPAPVTRNDGRPIRDKKLPTYLQDFQLSSLTTVSI